MVTNRILLMLLASVVIMLVGCKQPVGLPGNDVHVATVRTLYCTVQSTQNLSGYVDYYQGLNSYSRYTPTIKWGYVADGLGRPNPRSNGFCLFTVPAFESPGMVPVCTLFYYQTGHSGTAGLDFKSLSGITTWPGQDSILYKAVENGTLIGDDNGYTTDNAWYAVELNSTGMNAIHSIGVAGGGTLVTGWRYNGSTSGTHYATADGATDDNPPYIKVVYDSP
jgi:hypothetical protein